MRVGNEATAVHDNVGEVVRSWRSSWSEVRKTTAIAGGVVSSSELFRTLNTGLGVVGGQRTSTIRDKSLDSRPAVLSPFIACRLTVPALVLLCRLSLWLYSPICVHLLNCHFHIFTHYTTNYKAINHSYETSFRRLKRSMVALRTIISRTHRCKLTSLLYQYH